MKDIFWKLMFNILKYYMTSTMICYFYLKKMTTEKVEKLAANLHGKTESVIHIRNLKQAFKHGLLFKKFHRIINFKYNKTIY